MKYLNLETRTLHSPAYIGSNPVARATWLSIMLWCGEQENGGRIVGAKHWKARRWQQTCGVTLREINAASRSTRDQLEGDSQPSRDQFDVFSTLLRWESDDLCVSFYPVEQEEKAKARRESGGRGGSKSTEEKAIAARENGETGGRPITQAKTQAKTQGSDENNPSKNPTEGNGKEGKGSVCAHTPELRGVDLPTEDEWRAEFHRYDMPEDYADHQFAKLDGKMWDGVKNWRAKVKECKGYWLRDDMAKWRSRPKSSSTAPVRACDIPGPLEGPDPLEILRREVEGAQCV